MRWWCSALALLPWVLMALDAQLICWQALLRCHEEPECELAYNQYLAACKDNLRGIRQQCPSHCISALIRLNHTRSGPNLESCDCAQDAECVKAKRAIEPCLPRRHPSDAGGIGCMEARQRCEEDSSCHTSLTAYLSYCGQLFNGRKCSSKCKATIQQMLFIPNGMLLNRCVCDGVERPFCEVVKETMSKLCSIGDQSVISDQPDVEDIYEDEDYDPRSDREEAYLDYGDQSVISNQPDVDDIYEDEDYDPRSDREEAHLDYGDQSVISDQPDVEDIYEDEDYDPRSDREEAHLDYSSAAHTLPSCVTLLVPYLVWIY